jgi:hypothetical protein
LKELAAGGWSEAGSRRADRQRAIPASDVSATRTERPGKRWRRIDQTCLQAEIDRLLTTLESCHAAGILLPPDSVAQAATLIRLCAAPVESAAESWLDHKHAKRMANLFQNKRLLGSAIPLDRPEVRLNSSSATELMARYGPEPLEITLFELVRDFQAIYNKIMAKKRPLQWHDPV